MSSSTGLRSRLSTRAGSSSSVSSASAAASSPLIRTASLPKRSKERYWIFLKVKGEDQEVRNVLLVVLAEHEEIRAYGQGFDTREYNGTGFFAFKAHKLLKEATAHACAAAARFYDATEEEALAALRSLGPRGYVRLDGFLGIIRRGEDGALTAVKAAVARRAIDVAADDEPGPEIVEIVDSQPGTEDDDVDDEPPASPPASTSPRRARAEAAVATVTPVDARDTKAPRLSAASPDAPRPPSLAPPPLVNGGGAPVGGGVVPGPAALELGQFAPAPVPYSPCFPPPSMPPYAPYYQPTAPPPALQQSAVDIEATVRRLMAEGQARDRDRDRADAAVNGGLRAQRGGFVRKRCRSCGPRGSGARTGTQGAAGDDDGAPTPPAPAPPQPPPTATAVRAAAVERSLWVLSLNVRALTEEKLLVVRRALDELTRAGRRPDVICLQETWGTEASERRFALEGYRMFAFSRGGRGARSPGGGLATYVRSELRACTLEKGESGVVVELPDAVPAVHIANVYRSERADRELPVGARFFDFVGGAVDRARAAGAVAIVAGDFNVAGLESTDPAWPRAPGRLGSAVAELPRMRAWIDDRGLTVVSGAGCSPAEAVTRRSGDRASEIDYVVVDAGRGVDVAKISTIPDGYDPTSRVQLREHLVLPRGEVIHDVPEPMRVPRESPTIPGPDRTRGVCGNCRYLHYSMPVALPRWPAGPGQGPPRS
ncbi:hypothetical protein AURANDRAFT_65743 [Aureococcus anophagefferens]|uniref:Endonuclease/exonuclease/phosphatase domain-containing protein n=1 Tax=Aureococcus anophagefferens TaxID=44056 RepID=F0YF10_AURAN|nr:hypothetical protein AURANDRAFT_65743 [Aureococcus anophagefferens]EGB06345.1 hypothetical protein AURANDRAFT_65743 [Aureococcus anophagefferens]|eukprot:XP_009038925.1 hypothetical protein AURANDRAFT_65743 [Aureococcus anophagefferens]